MACRRPGDKPLSAPIMDYVGDALHVYALLSLKELTTPQARLPWATTIRNPRLPKGQFYKS